MSSLSDTRSELLAGRQEVDDVVVILNELESRPADLTPVYRRLRKSIDSIEHRAEAVQDRVQDMRLRANEYQTRWEQDAAQINNPDLRATAQERNAAVAEKYAEVDRRAQQVRASYSPFITELHDLETYLTNDLTYAGIQRAKPVIESVRTSADEVKKSVNALIEQLDETNARLSPTSMPVVR